MITIYRPTQIHTGHQGTGFTNAAAAQTYIDTEVIDPQNWQVQTDLVFDSLDERNEYLAYTPEQLASRQRNIDILKAGRR